MKASRDLVILLIVGILAAGCSQTNYTTPERYNRGLVVVLGGAGGITPEPQQICRGLDDGGVPYALEIYQWSSGNLLVDQVDVERSRRMASRLARWIEAYQRRYPTRPVHLIGVSAGSGLVVFTMEDLKEGHEVDTAVLLASSVSDSYDLSRALHRVKKGMINFYSLADVAILGIGVGLAGTVDRSNHIPAGRTGFRVPNDVSGEGQRLYDQKLYQFGWQPSRIIKGDLGGHLGSSSITFVRYEVAPIILGQMPEDESKER